MAVEVPRVKLGSEGLDVSKQGLGCMGMSAFYGPPKPEAEMIDLIHKAVEAGITFFDTADAYGPRTNEILLGKAIKGFRDKVQIATKFALSVEQEDATINVKIRGDPDYVRQACEASLRRLGVDCIDLYYQHRVDPNVPIEVTIGAMKELVKEGKVKYLGLSEASASEIRRAHAVHPITAVQLEWSLWARDVEEDVIPTCRELGIGIVAYSPLGRGFFSIGKAVMEGNTDTKNDVRKAGYDPRLMPENLEKNKAFYERLSAVAAKKNCSTGQLALAWVQHQGSDVVPIPGTTRLKNFLEIVGALGVKLSKKDMEEIEAAVPKDRIAGDRKLDMSVTWRYATTPPLSTWHRVSSG